jgi:Na+/H+ antiporter
MREVETVLALVVVATVVASFARHLRVPAPSLLVVAGVVGGLIPGVPSVRVTPDVVSLVVLPPLVYAAGEELAWRDLRRVWRPVAVLSVGLVVASAAAVAVVASAVTPLAAATAFVLGAILASTDPVAVAALARRLALPGRLQALVQAESLFNDATSLILFKVAVSVAVAGGGIAWAHAAGQLGRLAGGGVLAGAVVALGVGFVRARTDEPVLETVVVLLTPYLAYVLAEAVGGSGVTSVVVASVSLGHRAGRLSTATMRLHLEAVWGTAVFLLESVVFALIGLQLPVDIRALSGGERYFVLGGLAITATLLVMRVLWVFPMAALRESRRGSRLSWPVTAVVSWAGARGVVPLAAALSIPLTDRAGVPLADRDLVEVLATTVIVITLAVQGSSLAPLVRRAGIGTDPATANEAARSAKLALARSALAHLEQLAEPESASEAAVERVRRDLDARVGQLGPVEPGPADAAAEAGVPVAEAYRRLRLQLIVAERQELARLFGAGRIDEATRRRLQRLLDLEDAALRGGE